MLRPLSTTNGTPAAKRLPLLLAAGALLLTATTTRAHEDPPGCFQTGPAVLISVFRADGVTGLVGAVSECETITYRATLKKAVDDDALCAFSGGTLTLTTPDGVVHDLDLNVPCIGGTNAPCDPGTDGIVSDLVPYTIRVADVTAGFVLATANYVGGFAHDGDVDTAGVSAMSPKTTAVVRCDDGDGCTQNVCDPGGRGSAACSNPPVDCDDANACTNDACGDGVCSHVAPDPTCVPCETAGDCNDANACTTDVCTAGICGHTTPDPTCVPCETPGDCNDGNGCTTDVCAEGICGHTTPDPTCVPCETAGDCNDANACTTDTSAGGQCAHAPVDDCPVEVCDDGVDNDGDGAADCADTDCAQNPLCPTEICGNCVDDDGDDLVDNEDDDCCDNAATMTVQKMSVRTRPAVGQNKLRIKARYAPTPPPGFDPGLQGTSLQVSDADGTFFCQNIPFKSDPLWTRMGVFKFKDPTGLMAAGLRRARFKILKKKGSRVTFRTKGRQMQFRDPVGSDVLVTIRVGTTCAQANAALKTKKAKTGTKLVFP